MNWVIIILAAACPSCGLVFYRLGCADGRHKGYLTGKNYRLAQVRTLQAQLAEARKAAVRTWVLEAPPGPVRAKTGPVRKTPAGDRGTTPPRPRRDPSGFTGVSRLADGSWLVSRAPGKQAARARPSANTGEFEAITADSAADAEEFINRIRKGEIG